MKNVTIALLSVSMALLWAVGLVYAGQNASTAIRIDFNYLTAGNQGQSSIPPPGSGKTIYLEVRVEGASNLDTYEFDLYYPSSDLEYKAAYEDNLFSGEDNFLKKNGGQTIGWGATNYGTYINVRNTLVGNQGENTPDGAGLLALIKFTTKVNAPGNLTFGLVKWYDNNGVVDICTDKGEASLPVELSSFEAVPAQGIVSLRWRTESEVNSLGFNIHRSLVDSTGYCKINPSLIRGAGNSPTAREYCYEDRSVQNGVTYYYKLEAVDISGASAFYGPVSATPSADLRPSEQPPTRYELSQNVPNPFNAGTRIRYQLPEPAAVKLSILNFLGQEVRTLVEEEKPAGYFIVHWDGKDDSGRMLPSGVYLYRFLAGDFRDTRKMLLLR